MLERAEVLVLGTGFSGLCAAIELGRRGTRSMLVLDKAADVGGAWRDNTYPGVECDVPSHLYSLSTALHADWTKTYATGPEIHGYLRLCVQRYGLAPKLRLGAEVVSAAWRCGRWVVECRDGRTFESRFLISGLGALHTPQVPTVEGASTFRGSTFHTSKWDHSVTLAGRRVAMIGTGASAVQAAPEVAAVADQFHLFQRSPIWVGPKKDVPYDDSARASFAADERNIRRHRWELWNRWEMASLDLVRPNTDLNRNAEEAARQNLLGAVRDPETACLLMPKFNFACKRPTYSNAYFPMFNRTNVRLETAPIEGFTSRGIVSGGREIGLDAVIYATGFKAFDITTSVNVFGLGGVSLADVWRDRVTTYRSVMVPGFPNFFMLLGPNSGGLTSATQMIEGASRFANNMVEFLRRKGSGAAHPTVREVERFARHIADLTARTTIGDGCSSWWTRDGENHTLWPDTSLRFRMMMNEIRSHHFEFVEGAVIV